MKMTEKEWEERYESCRWKAVNWPPQEEFDQFSAEVLASMLYFMCSLNEKQVTRLELMRKDDQRLREFGFRRYFALGYQMGQAEAEKRKTTDTK